MASKVAEKLFNSGNITPAKKFFKVCPKFLDFMVINGETNASIRNHPCKFSLPIIKLPDRVDKAAAKFMRDALITEPKDLVKRSIEMNKALLSRNLVVEKDLSNYLRKRVKKTSILGSDLDDVDDVSEYIKDSDDPVMDDIVLMNASNIQHMQKEDVDSAVKLEMENVNLPPIYSQKLCNTYLVARLAPNFAASCRVFYEIRKRCPGFSPESLFDFGSGVGSATWAVNSVWPINTVQEHYLVDASTKFLEISEYLLKDGLLMQHNMAFPGVTFRSYLPASNDRFYDIVVSCYSLMDISAGYLNRREILNSLWRKTSKFLVLIDHGTIGGFQAILEARDWLLSSTKDDEQPAQLFAPCPHTMACPKAQTACTFSTKYFKLRVTESHDTVHQENFSYVVLHKGDISQYQDSVQTDLGDYPRDVSYKINGLLHDLCTKDGEVVRFNVDLKDRPFRRYLKRCEPGDLMPLIKRDNIDPPHRIGCEG